MRTLLHILILPTCKQQRLMAKAGSEKLIKMDERRREYDIVVIGEEPHLAYNRVGLTSFFQHRQAENLYLNPKEWVSTSWHPNY